MDVQWQVWHMGPDDIYEATGMLDAIKQAHAINAAAVEAGGYYDTDIDRPFMTLGWAIPIRKNSRPELPKADPKESN